MTADTGSGQFGTVFYVNVKSSDKTMNSVVMVEM